MGVNKPNKEPSRMISIWFLTSVLFSVRYLVITITIAIIKHSIIHKNTIRSSRLNCHLVPEKGLKFV